MIKRLLALAVSAVLALALSACSGPNRYGLSFTPDGSNEIVFLCNDGATDVYTVGGIMLAEIDGSPVMLDTALNDGKLTVAEIMDAANDDTENERIEATGYTDGSIELRYETFNLIKLALGSGDYAIYFTPSDMNYYDLAGIL